MNIIRSVSGSGENNLQIFQELFMKQSLQPVFNKNGYGGYGCAKHGGI